MQTMVSFSIENNLKRKIDRFRGDIPRSKFIVRLLESYIDNKEHKKDLIIKNRLEKINPPDDIFQEEQ
jgi:hypothetical protein